MKEYTVLVQLDKITAFIQAESEEDALNQAYGIFDDKSYYEKVDVEKAEVIEIGLDVEEL